MISCELFLPFTVKHYIAPLRVESVTCFRVDKLARDACPEAWRRREQDGDRCPVDMGTCERACLGPWSGAGMRSDEGALARPKVRAEKVAARSLGGSPRKPYLVPATPD